jgi:hypothetical protein
MAEPREKPRDADPEPPDAEPRPREKPEPGRRGRSFAHLQATQALRAARRDKPAEPREG